MAKKKSKQWGCVLLDSYNDEYYEGIEEMLDKERQDQIDVGEDPEDVYVQDIYSYINESSEQQYSDLGDYKFPKHFLVRGRYESRYGFGSGDGGKVLLDTDIYGLIQRAGKDCDYLKLGWEKNNGNLKFIGTHHDGTVYYEIREVTDKGVELYQDWDYGERLTNLDERELHEKMWNSRTYTKRITRAILG